MVLENVSIGFSWPLMKGSQREPLAEKQQLIADDTGSERNLKSGCQILGAPPQLEDGWLESISSGGKFC